MNLKVIYITIILSTLLFYEQAPGDEKSLPPNELKDKIFKIIDGYVDKNVSADFEGPFPVKTKLLKIEIQENQIKLYFNDSLSFQPVRKGLINDMKKRFWDLISNISPNLDIQIFATDIPLEKFIPGIYNPESPLKEKLKPSTSPVLIKETAQNLSQTTNGLLGRYICLWHSHGFYYDVNDKRWQWQRPRMFSIVEDKLPMSFTIPFLIPMLENAGATVFCPRERDIQVEEILVDDGDGHDKNGMFEIWGKPEWTEDNGTGFKNGLAPYPDDLNPHRAGHHRVVKTTEGKPEAFARWTPNFQKSDYYGVYISYNASPLRPADAHYTVNHSGGSTEYRINQRICGNYWVYLGSFYFKKGSSIDSGSVVLSNDSVHKDSTVSADCVKFGGGMGNVMRENTVSGYPRYMEGARYWMQYAGVVPKLVYKLEIKPPPTSPDYTEDYSGRPEWVNYLHGAPCGPNPERDHPGLGLPIDLSLSFHTDAGIQDGTVGTLVIYRIKDQNGNETFPDGRTRWLNRDLADILQSEIVKDIRSKYATTWSRRQIKDGDYAEARRPNVPSVLLELLSHQNFDDMKYALDPRFRLDVCRSIYKAMLRFIAYEYGYEPVISPLTPVHFSVKTIGPGSVLLRWQPKSDPMEPSAEASGYIVYTRKGEDTGFDNGVYVAKNSYELNGLSPHEIYSFKVVSANSGGKSLPTEILSVCTGIDKERRVLIVNAFDRIGPPEFIDKEGYRGVGRHIGDRGVGYIWNLALTGNQYDFDPTHKFLTNDNPGWGASMGDLEKGIELGNNFDYTIIHGMAIKSSGWTFDSASTDAVRSGDVKLEDYAVVDWLLGEERTTPPPFWPKGPGAPDRMKHEFKVLTQKDQEIIKNYTKQRGKLFISGAYVATDMVESPLAQKQDKEFLESVLKCEWVTNAGSNTNIVMTAPESFYINSRLDAFKFSFGSGENGLYGVELPDSINPAKDSGARTVLRYQDAYFSAGIAYRGEDYCLVVFGFPFETIISSHIRYKIMSATLSFLTQK